MLHMYALVRHPAAVPDTLGIGDAPLRALDAGAGIDAIVSETDSGSTAPTEEAILAHARVVDAVAAANDSVLPARFTGELTVEALRRTLLDRRHEVLEALERVNGCVELGLRVLPAGHDEPPRASSGGEYMRRRLEEVKRAQQLARMLHDSLAATARASACSVVARRDVVLTGAYLVRRDDVERFRATLDDAQRDLDGVTVVATGPWPPYSFALLDAEGT
jgi:hypothetical protein